MANSEVGSAYVSIIPSMRGFDSTVGDGLGKAVSTAAKVATAAAAAVGMAFVAVGKQALDSYSDYEQLAGGVDKIFGDAAGRVKQYAADAYVSAGLSANDYMQQVTSFSSALKQSFGGDVVKAAESANQAMVDMSDNANIFGSNIQDVQNAYQGFAKQNYTMLDNLKLGYGGTKTEMERLIADANAWEKANGRAGDLTIDKFGDVVQAIHDIQVQQGIAGDTAEEAAHTIAGSVAMAKAAWQNWLTGLADDNADTGQLTQNLIDSLMAVADNVGPRVQVIGQRIVENLPKVASMVGSALRDLLSTAVAGAWNSVGSMLSGTGIKLPQIDASQVIGAIDSILQELREVAPVIGGVVGAFAALKTASDVVKGVNSAIGALNGVLALVQSPVGAVVLAIGAVVGVLATLYATNDQFRSQVDAIVQQASSTIGPVLDGIGQALQAVGSYLADTFGPALQTLGQGLADLASNLGSTFQPAADALMGALQMIGDALSTSLGPAFQAIQPVLSGVASALAGVVAPALQLVADLAVNTFATAFTVAGSVISGAIQAIGGIVQAVVGTIEAVIGVFVGVFTGDWSMASEGAQTAMSGMSQVVAGILNALTGTVTGILNGIAGAFRSVFNGLVGIVGGIFRGVANAIRSPIDSAKNTVSNGLNAIAGFFRGLRISWPHIPVPHIKVSGSFNLDPAHFSVPHIGVSVYAKGGIVRHAALMGESGAEAIVPYTNGNIRPWAHALADAAFGQDSGGTTYVLNFNGTRVNDSDAIDERIQDFVLDMQRLGVMVGA